jgi:hypothetical protein
MIRPRRLIYRCSDFSAIVIADRSTVNPVSNSIESNQKIPSVQTHGYDFAIAIPWKDQQTEFATDPDQRKAQRQPIAAKE